LARGVRFVDEARITVMSGRGGDGCVSFRREKYVPRGGPDGGDGGRGGHVILVADPQITTLLDIGRARTYRAESGQAGRGRNQSGRSGEDLRIALPVGTVVRAHPGDEIVVDLDRPGLEHIIAHGGRGGRGNQNFATSTHQTPREYEPGGEEETRELFLELKLVADVGLLGLPNAGKSTVLSRVSAAHPRIADYPFTTLAPQLGIVELTGERRMVVADIPGIIEGAHRGVGLGLDFLRHLERTRALLHLLDPFGRDIDTLVREHRVIREELARHSPLFAERPKVTVINKADLVPSADREEIARALAAATGEPVHWISGVTGEGIPALLERLWAILVSCLRSS
jgi:GTP-binding protein